MQLDGSDGNGLTLTYTAAALPPGLTLNPGTGIISGTIAATARAPYPYSVTVTASNGTQEVQRTMAWTVSDILISGPSASDLTEGVSVLLPVQAKSLPGMVLTYAATGLPTGLQINPATGVIAATCPWLCPARSLSRDAPGI